MALSVLWEAPLCLRKNNVWLPALPNGGAGNLFVRRGYANIVEIFEKLLYNLTIRYMDTGGMDMFRIMPFNLKENAERGREMLERVFELAMDQPMNPIGKVSGALSSFKVDVIDEEDRYEIFAELPGFTKEEITISYDKDNHFRISAERLPSELVLKYICHERRTGKFECSFYVDDIDEEQVNASFENGVLHVILPKRECGKGHTVFDIN